jgi:hypothetical protein
MSIDQLHAESSGPHVMSISSVDDSNVATVITINVDSDLNPSTVAGAVSVSAGGQPVTVQSTQYDPDSRTLTVVVNPGDASTVTVTLAQSLQDVDGNALAAAFSAQVAA